MELKAEWEHRIFRSVSIDDLPLLYTQRVTAEPSYHSHLKTSGALRLSCNIPRYPDLHFPHS